MLANPSYWQGHYNGSEAHLYQQRHFGLADRIRYYWPTQQAQLAVEELKVAFDRAIPDQALSTVFETDVLDRAETLHGPQIQRLIDAQIEDALAPYFFGGLT